MYLQCDGTPGPKPDPDNCHDYYTCTPTNGGWLVQVSYSPVIDNLKICKDLKATGFYSNKLAFGSNLKVHKKLFSLRKKCLLPYKSTVHPKLAMVNQKRVKELLGEHQDDIFYINTYILIVLLVSSWLST